MRKYGLVIYTAALQDIQDATDWYNKQSRGLGARFQKQVKQQINVLKFNPHSFYVRYAEVRCMLVRKFPFLIHFVINEDQHTVEIFAVIHTSRHPRIWEERNST